MEPEPELELGCGTRLELEDDGAGRGGRGLVIAVVVVVEFFSAEVLVDLFSSSSERDWFLFIQSVSEIVTFLYLAFPFSTGKGLATDFSGAFTYIDLLPESTDDGGGTELESGFSVSCFWI